MSATGPLGTAPLAATPSPPEKRGGGAARSEAIAGYLFISPWLLGFFLFTLGPMLYSLYLSFTRYDPRGVVGPLWVGLDNYKYAFTNVDEKFYHALVNTFVYAGISIPLGMAGSLAVALLLTQEVKGLGIFRTIFYLPAVLPTIAVGMVFLWLFNTDYGLVNTGLQAVGLPRVDWLGNPSFVLPSYIIASLWGVGGGMMVLIAALKSIPRSYYEAATLDGAGPIRQFFSITLPQLSFVLYFNLIMGIIGALQVFDIAFVMGQGAGESHLFFVLYLYQAAWVRHQMGYASALAWILFAIILAIAMLVAKSSPMWVYYEGEKSK
ncbi:MAG: transporter permease [Cyanobacteria bacterium RYN_339]|nr:transporter permease [Cyanobacteria bacterium RYN_339]